MILAESCVWQQMCSINRLAIDKGERMQDFQVFCLYIAMAPVVT